MRACLENSSGIVPREDLDQIYSVLREHVKRELSKISDSATILDKIDDFEEKKEEEKQSLYTIVEVLECMPFVATEQ